MQEVEAIFIGSVKRTAEIESFRFSPVEDIAFLPGQFMQLIFDPVNRNNFVLNKYLSFSSAPGRNYFEVTKRISGSEFSNSLLRLKSGDKVLVKAPMGNCIFRDEYKKIGFLIGGIGITPVISILEYIAGKNLDTSVDLLYSNRVEEDIAFKAEIDKWSRENPRIKPVYTVTECRPKDSKCFFGKIDERFLNSHICGSRQRIIFIFGPPSMVALMKDTCLKTGCAEDNIKVENFTGY